MSENSLTIFTQAAKMLAEADTIQIVESQDKKEQCIAGIYAIFLKTKCIYIGESSNIMHRLSGHEYKAWFRIPGIYLFWFKSVNRKQTEKILIEKCKPLLNNKGSHVHLLAINEARGTPIEGCKKYLEDAINA